MDKIQKLHKKISNKFHLPPTHMFLSIVTATNYKLFYLYLGPRDLGPKGTIKSSNAINADHKRDYSMFSSSQTPLKGATKPILPSWDHFAHDHLNLAYRYLDNLKHSFYSILPFTNTINHKRTSNFHEGMESHVHGRAELSKPILSH